MKQRIIEWLKNAYNWLVWSSADPTKIALTIRGASAGLGAVIVMGAKLLGHDILPADIDAVFSAVADVVQMALSLVGAIIFAIGLLRKVFLTFFNR